ncbi:MAG: hypothetical protein PHU08_04445 [Dehalococcoidales bacterium]|nr:hypothetical protein [Dehalococcoidales bacterium]
MSITVGDILLKMGIDKTGLENDLKQINTQLEQNKKAWQENYGAVINYAQQAGIAMAAAGGAIVGTLGVATKLAIDQEKSIARLNVTLKNSGTEFKSVAKQVDAYISATMKSTSYSSDEQMDALSRLVAITGDYNMAMAALPAVLDAAAYAGTSVITVADQLGIALMGQTNNVRTLGLYFDETAGFQERLNEVMSRFQGMAEQTADPLKQIKNSLEDMGATIGETLVPSLKILTAELTAGLGKMQEFAKANPDLMKSVTFGTLGAGGTLLAAGGSLVMLAQLSKMMGVGMGTTLLGGLGLGMVGWGAGQLLQTQAENVGIRDFNEQLAEFMAKREFTSAEFYSIQQAYQPYIGKNKELDKWFETTKRMVEQQQRAADASWELEKSNREAASAINQMRLSAQGMANLNAMLASAGLPTYAVEEAPSGMTDYWKRGLAAVTKAYPTELMKGSLASLFGGGQYNWWTGAASAGSPDFGFIPNAEQIRARQMALIGGGMPTGYAWNVPNMQIMDVSTGLAATMSSLELVTKNLLDMNGNLVRIADNTQAIKDKTPVKVEVNLDSTEVASAVDYKFGDRYNEAAGV